MKVLELLLQTSYALSHADFERHLGLDYDRVTLYRVLHVFKAHGLVHSIFDANGVIKYALYPSDANPLQSLKHHTYINCTACRQTYYLNEVSLPLFDLPEGYSATNVHIAIQGICKSCNTSHVIPENNNAGFPYQNQVY